MLISLDFPNSKFSQESYKEVTCQDFDLKVFNPGCPSMAL